MIIYVYSSFECVCLPSNVRYDMMTNRATTTERFKFNGYRYSTTPTYIDNYIAYYSFSSKRLCCSKLPLFDFLFRCVLWSNKWFESKLDELHLIVNFLFLNSKNANLKRQLTSKRRIIVAIYCVLCVLFLYRL